MKRSAVAGICFTMLVGCGFTLADPPVVAPVVIHPPRPALRITPLHPAVPPTNHVAPWRMAQPGAANYLALRRPIAVQGRERIIATHGAGWHPDWDKSREYLTNGNRSRWRNGRWIVLAQNYLPYTFYYPPVYAPVVGYTPILTGPESSYNPYFYFNSNSGPIFYPMYLPAEAQSTGVAKSEGGDPVVQRVQGLLQEEGYYAGRADGVLGDGTRDALRHYQAEQGMHVTGEIDQPVLQSLGSESAR